MQKRPSHGNREKISMVAKRINEKGDKALGNQSKLLTIRDQIIMPKAWKRNHSFESVPD